MYVRNVSFFMLSIYKIDINIYLKWVKSLYFFINYFNNKYL